MAAGDLAATVAGFVSALSSDDLRLGYGKIDEAADLAIKYGQLRFATSTALLAFTGQGEGQRAVDTSTGDEYRWKASSSTWQLWSSAWKTWTPTYSGFTVGNATVSGVYRYVDGMVFAYLSVTLGSSSAFTGPLLFALPVAPTSQPPVVGKAHANVGSSPFPLFPTFSSTTGTQCRLRAQLLVGSYLSTADLGATVPATWATGHSFEASLLYRVY